LYSDLILITLKTRTRNRGYILGFHREEAKVLNLKVRIKKYRKQSLLS